ncbi:hypothetical protein [Brachybacterium sp. UMB0905]|uniref:hypothetical protein n=1 Tax=Brachybacterium sp. UMB0905 TaxID=2069310 RepID=UPI000C80BD92|nr:hypothetical protein [Brachybacterium sp. UMB0905]PMC74400.1 hypothetical protein CJ197_13555 [Brachybacterium sp. UMB0905]
MTTPPLLTERDAASAYALLAEASEDPKVLAVLSDEELLALGGPSALELVGSPFLDAAEFDRELAAAIAARSLIARGLVVLDDAQQENEGEDIVDPERPVERAAQLDRTLAGLLTLRSMPLAVLNLTRQVADQTTSVMVYVFPREGILEELITADGFHHFSLPLRSAVPARLARYVDQDQVAGDEDDEPIRATAAELEGEGELAEALRDTRALTVLTSAESDGSAQVSVMATSQDVYMMDTPSSPEEQVAVRRISAQTLQDLIGEVLPAPADA